MVRQVQIGCLPVVGAPRCRFYWVDAEQDRQRCAIGGKGDIAYAFIAREFLENSAVGDLQNTHQFIAAPYGKLFSIRREVDVASDQPRRRIPRESAQVFSLVDVIKDNGLGTGDRDQPAYA